MLETIVNPMGLRTAVLDIEPSNRPSVRLATRLGAERREPPRLETDRAGIPRTLTVYVLELPWRRSVSA
jgi:RimJ/RimL family protein N-acetyltransferase